MSVENPVFKQNSIAHRNALLIQSLHGQITISNTPLQHSAHKNFKQITARQPEHKRTPNKSAQLTKTLPHYGQHMHKPSHEILHQNIQHTKILRIIARQPEHNWDTKEFFFINSFFGRRSTTHQHPGRTPRQIHIHGMRPGAKCPPRTECHTPQQASTHKPPNKHTQAPAKKCQIAKPQPHWFFI